jgi:tRNA-Thr(GGU) m(6)t(6)A37 methyltransferase TsaA
MKETRGDWPEMVLQPVGIVRSEIRAPLPAAGDNDLKIEERLNEIREYHRRVENNICDVAIFQEFGELLEGLEDFSHILVLYWPHLISPGRRALRRVHPMGRKDLPLKGVFATRSPARPNPVLVSTVRLLERIDTVLRVRGLEAVDGSPVVDIKPYTRSCVENPAVPEWIKQIHRELGMDFTQGGYPHDE